MCFESSEGSSCLLVGSDLPQQICEKPAVVPAAPQRAAPNLAGQERCCRVLLGQVGAQVLAGGGLPGSVERAGSTRRQLSAEQPRLGPGGCWLEVCWPLCRAAPAAAGPFARGHVPVSPAYRGMVRCSELQPQRLPRWCWPGEEGKGNAAVPQPLIALRLPGYL